MTTFRTWASTIGGVCAAACFALAPAPAAAQTDDANYGPYAGTTWSLQTVKKGTGQCMMIANHGGMGLDRAGTKFVKERYGSGGVTLLEWTGACDANGLISGKGTLYIDLDETGDYYSKRFIGTADRGVLNGPVSYNAYYDIEAEEFDELDPDQPVTFVNGCNNWAGKRANNCDTRQADRLRSDYLSGRGTAAAKPAAPANPKPAPKPVAATPAKPAGPVPVELPPSQTGTLNAEQNAAAAAWLKADTEAKRIQAEKVADFERKKAEFDRKQAEYEKQQADYRAATAAHQAEVARIAKANADIDACNKGDRSRCPAPN
ncbi:cell envelope integrity protein TolA [Sphingopyxis sp. KK2]|uniref:cell envelope integrity protein TolA n=1 Tax=Sphingopyxis sp. KK2 TaxID=1855727 RepID=UPI00097E697C|nr:cell envelope integrity protein TolA [Sphingopyxis sp. KK2]